MLPLFLLLIFAKNYIVIKLRPAVEEEDLQGLDYYDEEEEADPDSKVIPSKQTRLF